MKSTIDREGRGMLKKSRRYEGLSLQEVKELLAHTVEIAAHQVDNPDLDDTAQRAWVNSCVQASMAYVKVYETELEVLGLGPSKRGNQRVS
jgi:hypothetical protein